MSYLILCDECFAKTDGVEKCCTHGRFAKKCIECGKERAPTDPAWHCRGSTMSICDCCKRAVESWDIDGIYGVCAPCAFEASLEHFPCDHGASERADREHTAAATSKKP